MEIVSKSFHHVAAGASDGDVRTFVTCQCLVLPTKTCRNKTCVHFISSVDFRLLATRHNLASDPAFGWIVPWPIRLV